MVNEIEVKTNVEASPIAKGKNNINPKKLNAKEINGVVILSTINFVQIGNSAPLITAHKTKILPRITFKFHAVLLIFAVTKIKPSIENTIAMHLYFDMVSFNIKNENIDINAGIVLVKTAAEFAVVKRNPNNINRLNAKAPNKDCKNNKDQSFFVRIILYRTVGFIFRK